METVQTRVEETHELKGTEGVKVYRLKGRPRLVVEDKWRVAENATTQEVMTSTGHPMEGYLFSRHLDLPRNLRYGLVHCVSAITKRVDGLSLGLTDFALTQGLHANCGYIRYKYQTPPGFRCANAKP